MTKFKGVLLGMVLAAFATVSNTAYAEDYYVGYSFIDLGSEDLCIIVRFRRFDGSFSLSEADGLYNLVVGLVTDFASDANVKLTHTIPSAAKNEGLTGEGLATSFLNQGVDTCKVGGVPVSAMGFISMFNCEYQLENQMCMRLYVDTGDTNLSLLGIPQAPAAIGGIFIKREVWNATKNLVLSNPNIIPDMPFAAPKLNPVFDAVISARSAVVGNPDVDPPDSYMLDAYIDP